jgi:hypothetical protein
VQATPAQLIFGAQRALGRVHSFHLQGTSKELDGVAESVSADIGLPGRIQLTLRRRSEVFELRIIGAAAYLRGNHAYWSAVGHRLSTSAIAVLADRWIRVSPGTPGVGVFTAWTNPATLGECTIGAQLGTVTVAGRTTIRGKPAVALLDHGDLPGSAPGTLYVAAKGPPLPLRITQTAPGRRGGVVDPACQVPKGGESNDSPTATRTSTDVFSRYNEVVRIEPPVGVLDPGHLASRIAASAPTPHASRRTLEARMVGTWLASGRVVEARNWADEHPGQTIDRAWQIRRQCSSGGCQLYLTRQTAQTPLTTELVWAGGRWTASFRQIVPCTGQGGLTSVQSSRWTIGLLPAGIVAVEQGHADGSCLPASNVIQWSASKAPNAQGSARGPVA